MYYYCEYGLVLDVGILAEGPGGVGVREMGPEDGDGDGDGDGRILTPLKIATVCLRYWR